MFSNGSFVCWGMGEADARLFAKEVIAKAGVELAPLKEPETEELDFVTDPNECVNARRFGFSAFTDSVYSGVHVCRET